jgi:serine kinase of HPr protein (carbohydrate metabolism regulator)
MDTLRLHASCAVVDGRAVLLRGASGAGKSDLLLRLIVEAGAGLVADDQVLLDRHGDALRARAPAALAGVLEARGMGLLRLPAAGPAPVALLADLGDVPQRLPEPAEETLLGCRLPRVEIDPRAASAVAKLQLALGARGAAILPADWHPGAPADSGSDREDTR